MKNTDFGGIVLTGAWLDEGMNLETGRNIIDKEVLSAKSMSILRA